MSCIRVNAVKGGVIFGRKEDGSAFQGPSESLPADPIVAQGEAHFPKRGSPALHALGVGVGISSVVVHAPLAGGDLRGALRGVQGASRNDKGSGEVLPVPPVRVSRRRREHAPRERSCFRCRRLSVAIERGLRRGRGRSRRSQSTSCLPGSAAQGTPATGTSPAGSRQARER